MKAFLSLCFALVANLATGAFAAEINRGAFSLTLPQGWVEKQNSDTSYQYAPVDGSVSLNIFVQKNGPSAKEYTEQITEHFAELYDGPVDRQSLGEWADFHIQSGWQITGRSDGVPTVSRVAGLAHNGYSYVVVEDGNLDGFDKWAKDIVTIRRSFEFGNSAPLALPAGETADSETLKIEEFEKLEDASLQCVRTDYAEYYADPDSPFHGLLIAEIERAERLGKPILKTPDWPEKIAAIVAEDYRKSLAESAHKAEVTQPSLAVEPEHVVTDAATPAPRPFGLDSVGWFILLVIVTCGPVFLWGVYTAQADQKLRQRGYIGEDAQCYFGRLTFLIALIGTYFAAGFFVVIFLNVDERDMPFAAMLAGIGCLGPVFLRLRALRMSPWWLAAFSSNILFGFGILLYAVSDTLADAIITVAGILRIPAAFVVFGLNLFLLFTPSKRQPRELLPPPLPGRPQAPTKPKATIGKIYFAEDGRESGPYTLLEALQVLDHGRVSESALYWHEKLPTWKSLAEDLPALREMA